MVIKIAVFQSSRNKVLLRYHSHKREVKIEILQTLKDAYIVFDVWFDAI